MGGGERGVVRAKRTDAVIEWLYENVGFARQGPANGREGGMRYFLDCEFIERGSKHPVELVSIAVVADNGREFYAVSTEFRARHASEWVKANVLPLLPERKPIPPPWGSPRQWDEAARWMKRAAIRDGLLAFVGGDPAPEFWGWCCGFDYVLVSQLVGFDAWPAGWPYYFRDVQQEADRQGVALETQPKGQHDALADARWVRRLHNGLCCQGDPSEGS